MYEESHKISLENFEGPLDLLLYLIQRNEINIYDIPIHSITSQFLQEKLGEIDIGAEFLGGASTLFLLKSERLLPSLDAKKEEEDPYLAVLKSLIEYCSFKEVAKKLNSFEENERFHFPREPIDNIPIKQEAQLPEVSLDELKVLFERLMAKRSKTPKVIEEQGFLVSERLDYLRNLLNLNETLPFHDVFRTGLPKDELIATFLALLQLMKQGELIVTKDENIKRTTSH